MTLCSTSYRALRIAALAILTLTVCMPVSAGEFETDESLKNQAAALLSAGNFAGFDRIATQLRNSSARTPAGTWKLSMFYSGVARAGNDDPNAAVWTRLEAGADQYLREHPDSPTAVVLDAKVLIEHAAAYRGDGYASQVPRSRWGPFYSHVDATRQLLDSHREVGSADPEWYAIRVWAMNLRDAPKEELLAFTREALERHPQYYPIHYRTARALLPKWGGSKALVQQYLAVALDRTRASEGTQIYGRVMFNLATNSNRPHDELAEIDAKWLLFKASYEEILQAYPDPYNLGALRAMACLAGKKEDYKAITQRVTGTAPSVAWFDTPQKQRDCDDWAFRNKSFSPGRLPERMWGSLLALLPVVMGVLLTLLRIFGRRAGSTSAATANKPAAYMPTARNPTVKNIVAPVAGMAELGVPVDQSWRHVLAQLLRLCAVVILVLLVLFAAWRAFEVLR